MTQTADILRKGEIPEDIMQAAEDALDNVLCNDIRASGTPELFRKDCIHDIAAAILADRQRDQWQPIETAPKTGFFLVHSPDHAGIPMTVKAEIFHEGRKPGTPHHLSFNHFQHWMPCPPEPKGGEA